MRNRNKLLEPVPQVANISFLAWKLTHSRISLEIRTILLVPSEVTCPTVEEYCKLFHRLFKLQNSMTKCLIHHLSELRDGHRPLSTLKEVHELRFTTVTHRKSLSLTLVC